MIVVLVWLVVSVAAAVGFVVGHAFGRQSAEHDLADLLHLLNDMAAGRWTQ